VRGTMARMNSGLGALPPSSLPAPHSIVVPHTAPDAALRGASHAISLAVTARTSTFTWGAPEQPARGRTSASKSAHLPPPAGRLALLDALHVGLVVGSNIPHGGHEQAQGRKVVDRVVCVVSSRSPMLVGRAGHRGSLSPTVRPDSACQQTKRHTDDMCLAERVQDLGPHRGVHLT
jgi:hypothetical protein